MLKTVFSLSFPASLPSFPSLLLTCLTLPQAALNSRVSCLSLPSTGVTDVLQQACVTTRDLSSVFVVS